jgi:hypothetical protein
MIAEAKVIRRCGWNLRRKLRQLWLRDDMGQRKIAEHARVDRKNGPRYVECLRGGRTGPRRRPGRVD